MNAAAPPVPRAGRALLLAAACAAAGCAGLPDLERGKLALARGDIAAAQRDLQPLANSGYPEARIRLASVYAQSESPADQARAVQWYRAGLEQDPTLDLPLARVLARSGTPEALAEAERLLRQAQDRGEPRALAELIVLFTDHPERDPYGNAQRLVQRAEALGSPLPELRAAVVRWYRKSPAGTHLGQQLALRCEEALDQLPDCHVDLVRHYRASGDAQRLDRSIEAASRAHAQGRLPQPVLERVARMLVAEDLPTEPRPEAAHRLLRQVQELSPDGQVLLARLLIDYPFLDADARPEEVLAQAYARGSAEAALALGRLYLDGRRVVADPPLAERYLQESARSLPAAQLFLGRLYERGELGESDPARALEHYLAAARGGDHRADLALARLYSANRGAKPDRVNAYIFATLAWRNAVPHAEQTRQQLRDAMTPAELQYAELLVQQELAARSAAAGDTATAARPAAGAPAAEGPAAAPRQGASL